MPRTKAKELRELSAEDITAEIAKAKRDLFDLRFKKATRQMESGFHEFKQLRRRLAQLKTIERERQIEEEQKVAAEKAAARVKEAASPKKTPEEKKQARAAKRKAKAQEDANAASAENAMETNPLETVADSVGATASAAATAVTNAVAAVTGSSEEE